MFLKLNKILLISLVISISLISLSYADGRFSPHLAKLVNNYKSTNDSLVNVVVFLNDQSNQDAIFKTTRNRMLDRAQRIKSVIQRLKNYTLPDKNQIFDTLSKYSTTPVKKHWIVPAFTATIPLSKLNDIARFSGVKQIVENVELTYEPPVEVSSGVQQASSVISNELSLLKIPELWKRGLKGKGRLICSFDTGVEESHPALVSKWRGNHASLASSWFSKVAPDSLPYDKAGHGTHTMGIMVGATEADSFGVAPEAEWITAGVIDQGRSLSLTISDILDAFQWALNPDGDTSTTDDVPDVILNSWGIPKGLFVPCDDTFWGVIDNVEAAGIVTIFAAGNEGPEPMTMRSPADRATTPIDAFAVGAVDDNKVITSFSSRGPSSCDTTQIKPEVVAPGVNIRSSYKGGGYIYMTGTSMAAPYIAGLVALIRQYNPNATVDQIKYALINSAEDLGQPGEDNAYGYGLVDASKILNYIPAPSNAEFTIVGTQISDDGIAFPGEAFGLQIVLNNAAANIESVTGTILTDNKSGVTLANSSEEFYFGVGGTTAINSTPFGIVFDSNLYNGQQVSFQLLLASSYLSRIDTLDFTLTVGISPRGNIALQANGIMSLSVSDFGQFGFAPGSIYNVNGEGFRFNNSNNLLYEAGLIIGRNNLQMSTSIRNENGTFKPSDFTPVDSLSDSWQGYDNDIHRLATFNDKQSSIPIPINVSQETIVYNNSNDQGLLITKYILKNTSLEQLTNMNFGFLCDFDLSDSDVIHYDSSLSLMYQENGNNLYVGMVALKNINGFQEIDNGTSKIGFSSQQLLGLVTNNSNVIDDSLIGDVMFVASSSLFSLNPNDSFEVTFALVGGNSITELYDNALQAKQKYDIATDVNNTYDNSLPDQYTLFQNYPNPFNPTTTISFSLPQASDVELSVYNLLGQRVKTIYSGKLPSGIHHFDWDATNENGSQVATGVYFYRLSTNSFVQTKKMMLLR
ncbi:MAG: S8 family serine peptidase [FCB group bacterium]|nr:S8 family serine peptidase [FCB group bacterium]